MLYQNLYRIFSCYLPSSEPALRYLYSCSYNDVCCSVVEIRCLSPYLRTETDPLSEPFCRFVRYHTKNKSKDPVNLSVVRL
jgi:hypothetical protein